MGSNGVVSTRVEALGVSITIVDGSIAIEQTGSPSAAPKGNTASSEVAPASAQVIPAQPTPPDAEYTPQLAADEAMRVIANAINHDRTPPNGSAELDETQSTKIGWTDDEIEQLRRRIRPTRQAS